MRKKHLTCGCCGTWFKTWHNYRDQDQDKGYGICKRCQVDDAWRDYEAMSNLMDRFADCLTTLTNRATWEGMDYPTREAIIYEAMHDGLITWSLPTSRIRENHRGLAS